MAFGGDKTQRVASLPVWRNGAVGLGDDGGAGGVSDLGGDLGIADALGAADGDVEGAEAVAGAVGEAEFLGDAGKGLCQGANVYGGFPVPSVGNPPGMFRKAGVVPFPPRGNALLKSRVDEGKGVGPVLPAFQPKPVAFDETWRVLVGGVGAKVQDLRCPATGHGFQEELPTKGLGLGTGEQGGGELVEFVTGSGHAVAAMNGVPGGMESGPGVGERVPVNEPVEQGVEESVVEGVKVEVGGASSAPVEAVGSGLSVGDVLDALGGPPSAKELHAFGFVSAGPGGALPAFPVGIPCALVGFENGKNGRGLGVGILSEAKF